MGVECLGDARASAASRSNPAARFWRISSYNKSCPSSCPTLSMFSDEVVTSPRAAFRNRDFRLYQFVRLFSIVAFEMQSVAVGWQIYEITHRAIDLGYVGLAQFLPGVLLFLVAGHAADRFDRRRVLLICNSAYAGCSVLLLLNAHVARNGVATIYVIITMLGVVRAFSGPASQSLMPQLVPAE